MRDEFDENIRNRGKEGAEWAERIPLLITEYEKKWGLRVKPPFTLTWNYVAPATRTDGSEVVLKIGFPADKEFRTEIAALKIFGGDGMARILEEDVDNHV